MSITVRPGLKTTNTGGTSYPTDASRVLSETHYVLTTYIVGDVLKLFQVPYDQRIQHFSLVHDAIDATLTLRLGFADSKGNVITDAYSSGAIAFADNAGIFRSATIVNGIVLADSQKTVRELISIATSNTVLDLTGSVTLVAIVAAAPTANVHVLFNAITGD